MQSVISTIDYPIFLYSIFHVPDDPNMTFAEITDEFEPCSLSESEDDSHGGTKTHMS